MIQESPRGFRQYKKPMVQENISFDVDIECFPDLQNLQKNLKGFWESIYSDIDELLE